MRMLRQAGIEKEEWGKMRIRENSGGGNSANSGDIFSNKSVEAIEYGNEKSEGGKVPDL